MKRFAKHASADKFIIVVVKEQELGRRFHLDDGPLLFIEMLEELNRKLSSSYLNLGFKSLEFIPDDFSSLLFGIKHYLRVSLINTNASPMHDKAIEKEFILLILERKVPSKPGGLQSSDQFKLQFA